MRNVDITCESYWTITASAGDNKHFWLFVHQLGNSQQLNKDQTSLIPYLKKKKKNSGWVRYRNNLHIISAIQERLRPKVQNQCWVTCCYLCIKPPVCTNFTSNIETFKAYLASVHLFSFRTKHPVLWQLLINSNACEMGTAVIEQLAFMDPQTKMEVHVHYFDNRYISMMQRLKDRTKMLAHLCDRLVIIKQRQQQPNSQMSASLAWLLALRQTAKACGTIVVARLWTHAGCMYVAHAHDPLLCLGTQLWNQQIYLLYIIAAWNMNRMTRISIFFTKDR